ncbi:MAG: DegT/DnrJ/EryC1/StrS family aminotransferase [Bacteroidia bacterium]
MVDLKSQYQRLKSELDAAIQDVLDSGIFIKGSIVSDFENNLSQYIGGAAVISCANGTDALQIAMMALDLKPGDEVILPAFTYAATAEVIALLGLVPVLVDVDKHTFNINVSLIEKSISSKTKAIVPVHLFGQCADMESILKIASKNNLFVIEDAAQSIGSVYTFSDGTKKMAGTMGDIGTTSFFPSKNLGCFGDGGAVFTNNPVIAEKLRMIANHGQKIQYKHDIIGVNSRLDAIQAAVLNVKLKYLNAFEIARKNVADFYDSKLSLDARFTIPVRSHFSSHVFHQYTMILNGIERDQFRNYLKSIGIPSMVYYPTPIHHQEAFKSVSKIGSDLSISERLSKEVISLPIHTEMDKDQIDFIIEAVLNYDGINY